MSLGPLYMQIAVNWLAITAAQPYDCAADVAITCRQILERDQGVDWLVTAGR
jgi:hypothetical protein